MQPRDPLYAVELVRVLEESTSMLRHDVRNRLGSIRNMAYFVNKRFAKSEAAPKEPRVAEFLGKIESEVQWTDDLIEAWFVALQAVHTSRVEAVEAAEVVKLARGASRVDPAVAIEVRCEDALIEADLRDLALAVRCLIENAAEATTDGKVSVEAVVESATFCITVKNEGPVIPDGPRGWQRFQSTKPGHLGLGLCVARRAAQRFGGKLVFGSPASGADVSLILPLAGSGIHSVDGG